MRPPESAGQDGIVDPDPDPDPEHAAAVLAELGDAHRRPEPTPSVGLRGRWVRG